eukprot:m.416240 g.416240  ORF g.416240 m.416240 type:complete len:690 (+) comp29892_c0_seq1:131-2200(+)
MSSEAGPAGNDPMPSRPKRSVDADTDAESPPGAGRITRRRVAAQNRKEDEYEKMLSMTKEELIKVIERLKQKDAACAAPVSQLTFPAMRTDNGSTVPTPAFDKDAASTRIIDDIEGRTGYASLIKNLNFDYREYVERVLTKILNGDKTALVCGGHTQSQKTGFKVVLYLIAVHLDIDIGTIVVTKGVAESQNLAAKMKKLLDGRPAAELIISQTATSYGVKAPAMVDILDKGGCIVSAHLGHQTKKDLEAVRAATSKFFDDNKHRYFFLIFDEADDYERSPEGPMITKLEAAQHDLWEHGKPLIVSAVTATMLPLFTNERYESVKGSDLFVTAANDYFGVLETKPFRTLDGKMVCIPTGATTVKTNFLCPELWAFYEQASKNPKALLLDVISPRVWAAGNNRTRALLIQKRFPNVCFIVITGSEIMVLRPGDATFSSSQRLRDTEISDVLTKIDTENKGAPIFVLGYSKMERSMSYRSDQRLPTHMTVDIGKRLSFERLIQTLGRCTGRFVPPGHRVSVLTNGLDYDAAKAYIRFQMKLISLMVTSPTKTAGAIITEHTFADEESFWAFNTRPVAQQRAKRSSFFKIKREAFDYAADHREGFRVAFDDVNGKNHLWLSELFDTFLQFPETELSLATLVKNVKERLSDDDQCSPALLKKTLAVLTKKQLIVKMKGGGDTWMWNDVDVREQ